MANITNTTHETLITGTSSADFILNHCVKVTISTGNGNDIVNNLFNSDYNYYANDDLLYWSAECVSINTGAGNDSVYNNSGQYCTINTGTGNDYVDNDNGDDSTINTGAGNDSVISYWSEDCIINTGAGNDSVCNYQSASCCTINTGTENDLISFDTSSWGNIIIYSSGDGNDVIYGFNNNRITLSISGSSYSTEKSGDDIIVTVDDGKITLVGAASLSKVNIEFDETTPIETNSWNLSGTTATYGDLITIKGVKSLGGINLSGTTVTISKASLGTSKVTISDGYTLALADDVDNATTKTAWSISGTTATYKQTTTAGYSIADNVITYNKKSTKTLATVTGVKSTKGLSVSGNVITVAKASLNAKKVTISNGYTLALADDVSESTAKTAWSISGTTATYKQTMTSGYSIADNVITYNKKSTKTLATVTGVKSTKGLSVSGNVVTVSKASLNAKKVTISDGYTLALADDVDEPTTKKAAWSLKSSTATYKSSGKTAGYTLASNSKSITYSKATTASTLATVKGVKSTGGLKVSGEKITLKKSALNSKVTISGDYEFDFASDYSKATITGSKNSDLITVRGKKISVNGGAGDDTIKILGSGTVTGGDGADTFYLKSSVANVITDYAEEDKISLASGNANVSISGDDVIFNGKITINGGADKKITYIDAGGENIYSKSADDYKIDGKTVTILDNYTKESFDITNENSIQTIDASAAQLGLTITGNKLKNKIIGSSEDDIIYGMDAADTILGEEGNDKLYGGKGNDKIYGGNGDDSLWGDAGTDTLIGGDGADTFVYKNGDNKIIIDDFDDTLDKIRVMSGDVNNPYTAGGDVIFEVGSGQIVIKNGSDKFIPIYYGKGNNNIVQRYREN